METNNIGPSDEILMKIATNNQKGAVEIKNKVTKSRSNILFMQLPYLP